MINDHLYDAGWPRNDNEGCIAVWSRDSGPKYARSAGDVCAAPESSHAGSEYLDERENEARAMSEHGDSVRPWYAPGDMHEPKPYTGKLDWSQDISDRWYPR